MSVAVESESVSIETSESAPRSEAARFGPRHWLWFHLRLGLFGFGHGAIMPLYERTLVRESRVLSEAEFQQALTVALMLPGPSLVTLCMYLGKRLFGPWVGFLGVLSMCVPGALWALAIVSLIPLQQPGVAALFDGFTVGALVLLLGMLVRMHRGITAGKTTQAPGRAHYVARLSVAIGVAALLLAHVPMAQVALLGVLACLIVEFSR